MVKPTNKRAADHIASRVARHRPPPRRDAPAYAAARGRLGLTALLFGLAAVAWWFTVDRIRGMDQGPGTDLGTLAWFLAVWLVMMTAMMLPSVSPTVALYSRMTRTRAPGSGRLHGRGQRLALA